MISGKKMRAGCLALAAAALGALSAPAVAESPLTAVEWSTLPDYCKAAMLKSAYRHIVPSSNRLTPTWAFSVPNTYGVPGAHHFCMGMVLLDRAKKRQASYRDALNELTYSHVEMDSSQPGYPYVTHYVATAHYRSGDRVRAYNLWQDCIEAQPQSRYCYLSMADALLTDKRPRKPSTCSSSTTRRRRPSTRMRSISSPAPSTRTSVTRRPSPGRSARPSWVIP